MKRRASNSRKPSGRTPSAIQSPRQTTGDIPTWAAVTAAACAAVLPFAAVLPALASQYLGSDQTDLNLQYRHFIAFAVRWIHQGTVPMWNPHTFCGGPFLPNTAATIFSPTCAPLLLTLPQPLSVNLVILLHCVLLATGTVWWARGRGLSNVAALMAGVLSALSAVTPCRVFAGHYTIVTTLAWFPWVLGAQDRHLLGKRINPAFFGALCALMFLGGHAQYVYYGFLLLFLNLLATALTSGRWCRPDWLRAQAGFHLLAGFIALMLAGIELLPLADAMRYSARAGARGVDWLRFFSMPPENFLSMLAPRFLGSGIEYWGRWYWWEVTAYTGWTGLALVAVAAAGQRGSRPVTLLILLGATLVLACAGFLPGVRDVAALIPGWAIFRGHSKILGPGMIIAAIVAAHGLEMLRSVPTGRPRRASIWVVGLLGLVCLALVASAGYVVPAWFLKTDDRMALADSPENPLGPVALTTWRFSFAVAAAWAAMVTGWLALRPRLSMRVWSACGFVIALTDGLFYAMPSASATFTPERDKPLAELAAYVKQQTKHARIEVPGILLAADPMTAGFEAAGGHDINITKYFDTFAAALLEEPIGMPRLNFVADRESPLLDTANVMYFVPPGPQEAATMINAGHEPVGVAGGLQIFRRPHALPRAYVTGSALFVPEDEEAIWQILVSNTAIQSGTVLTGPPPAGWQNEEFAPVEAKVEYRGLHEVRVTAPRDGWLVLNDGYSPRWRATIAGKPAPIRRATSLFRAVRVRSGDEVRFMLDRSPFAAGAAMTAAGLITLAISVILQRRRKIASATLAPTAPF